MAEELNLSSVPLPTAGRSESLRIRIRKTLDGIMQGMSTAGALAMVVLLAALVIVLFVGALPAVQKFGIGFLTGTDWNPMEDIYGALPFIYGTIVSAAVALCIAVPMSLGAALFLTRIAPRWLSGPVSFLIELLAAIPSIVYGFWGQKSLIPFLQQTGMPFLKDTVGKIPWVGGLFSGPAAGFSMLAAGIVLAIMVMPIITAVTRDVLQTVPIEIEEGAYALGATWWQSAMAILNYGKLGIFGAIILGFARAIGETMAVTMVIGNNDSINYSLFGSGSTIATKLANEFQSVNGPMHLQSLTYLALVLLVLTLILNFAARMLVRSIKNESAGKRRKKDVDAASIVNPDSTAIAAHLRDIPIASINYTVRYINVVFKSLCILAAAMAIVCLAMIFSYVLFKGVTSLSWNFFTMNPGAPGNPIGMKNCIQGTIILVGVASLIGVPLGMLCGIYLSEYAKKNIFNDAIRLIVDVLAGTPSIIAGVLAYELIIAKYGHFPSMGLGFSGWGGAMSLAFLMVPIIARTTEEMLRLVPASYREASLALGGAKYQTILQVVLPAATSGIVTGVMLSIARVAGETAPLLFTAFGSDQDVIEWGNFPFIFNLSKPFPALTLKIYQYADSPSQEWIEQAWAGMLVLIVMVTVLSAAVRFVTRSKKSAKA